MSSATSWAPSTPTRAKNTCAARSRGFDHVTVVWASGDEGPEEFFKAVGFEIIGETPYGEKLGALKL